MFLSFLLVFLRKQLLGDPNGNKILVILFYTA